MTSWDLLHYLTTGRQTSNPVFQRASQNPPAWVNLTQWMSSAAGILLPAGGLVCYLITLMAFVIKNPLILILPLLGLWVLIIGMTLSSAVVEERERHTWETLCATPFTIQMLLLSRTGGALWRLRTPIRTLSSLVILVGMGVGLSSLFITPTIIDTGPDLPAFSVCCLIVMLPVASGTLFVIDRAQQFVLMITASLAASASASSQRSALASATSAAMLAWMADLGLGLLVLLVRAPGQEMMLLTDWIPTLATMGPVVNYLATLSLVQAALFTLLTLALREAVIQLTWRWIVRAASSQ